jgi:hypothetical protein
VGGWDYTKTPASRWPSVDTLKPSVFQRLNLKTAKIVKIYEPLALPSVMRTDSFIILAISLFKS